MFKPGCVNTEKFHMQDSVYIPDGVVTATEFEQLYLKVRGKEQRIYTDDELMRLPEMAAGHQHYKEWKVRKKSSESLTRHLQSKSKSLQILEVGCGNGWLANKLAEIPQTDVVALDINLTELGQGAKLFRKSNLQFVYGDLRQNILIKRQFDIIVFAASLPYFSPLNEIIECALDHLLQQGEIHIVDNFFYDANAIETARQNCRIYYDRMGIPAMADYYFHYSLDDLTGFNYKVLNESNFLRKLFVKADIFPWISIRH